MGEEYSVGAFTGGPFQGDGAQARLRWRVGPWEVDAGVNTITGVAGTAQVEPKVMQLLLVFLHRPGETLSVDYLLEVVWEDTIVEENALRRAISRLRKAFDDDPQQPQVLQTIPKRGYRLIAPVTPADQEDRLATTAPLSQPPKKAATGLLPGVQEHLQGQVARVLIVPVLIIVVLIGAVVLADQRHAGSIMEPLTNVPVTSLPGLETEAALSPDGSTIAFVWSGDTSDAPKIYIKDLEADAPRRLTDELGTEHSPSWSPDGQWVAYLRRDEQGCGLYVAPVAGGGVRRLRACGAQTARGLTWSSDGAWIAYAEAETPGEPVRLFLLSPETLERRPLTAPTNGQMDTDPVFAPGGDRLSFVRHEASGREGLYVVPVADGAPVQVLSDFGNMAEHDWTPDGQHLVFSSNQGGNYRLWQVAIAGGAPRWLAAVGAYDPSSPSLARQGMQLAYVEWFFDFNIWHYTTLPGQAAPARRIASSKWDLHPQYAPDGQRIVFTSNRSGTSELWVAEQDGTKPVRLTNFGGAFVSTPRWSPDGRYIAFEVRETATSDIYIIQAEGGVPRQLTDSTASDVAPSWSADGQRIYAGSMRSGRWEVWKIPVASGEATPLTEAGGFAAFEAFDGRSVYYTKADTAGVWRRSLEGGPEEQVMTALATGDWGNWALHRTGIYFVQRTQAGPQLTFFDFASEAIRTVAPVGASVAWNKAGLALSPDGTDLLITHTDHYESDIRLVPSFH